jgi:hypothetical protein
MTGATQDIGDEDGALADLLESTGGDVWESLSLCEGWRTARWWPT